MTFRTGILLFAAFVVNAQQVRQIERDKPPQGNLAKKTALVIGNGAYAVAPLRNPVNDAVDVAASLKQLGFDVMSYTNIDQVAMKRAIREFGSRIRSEGSIGLFYYAGHGVQVKGENYLIPVGADVNSEEEVEYEGVQVGLVLAQMEAAKNGMNIVILDACRNNPFARSYRSNDKGLAQINAPSGTIIAYSTAPGSVASDGAGRNGIYTQELLKQIKSRGSSIEDVFKQVRISVRKLTAEKQTPWESSSLTGEFYFSGTGPSLKSESKASMPVERSSEVEDEYWANIKGADDPKLFEGYLTEYPSGKYAALARQRISTYEMKDETGTSAVQYLSRGTASFGKGRHDEAITYINRAIAMAPENPGAYFVRGNVYLFGKKLLTQAITDFDKCVELDPKYFGCYNGRGLSYHERKDYQRAIEDFTDAIRLNPRWEPSYTFRASSYDKIGDKQKADADRANAKNIKSGKGVSVPEVSRPQSATRDKKIVEESMFTFELIRCVRSGSMVACDLVITNNDKIDKKLEIPFPDSANGRTFDDQGGQSELDSWQIGAVTKREALLIPGVPVKAYFRFKGVSPQASVLKRMDLGFQTAFSEGGDYKRREVIVKFSDVVLP